MEKICKRDLPRKNFQYSNILASLVRAINNRKYGNFIDCGFKSEDDFKDALNILEKSGAITKKSRQLFKDTNIGNYNYSLVDQVDIKGSRGKLTSWIMNNAIGLASLLLSVYQLF